MFAGMLTGRPEEEMSGSQGDPRAVPTTRASSASSAGVAQAMWRSASPPGSMEELVKLFQGARPRFRLWKISACREGVREAWDMVKTRYTKLDLNHMAWVGPRGSDGHEIPVSLVYDQVKIAAKFSQQDCKLDSL